MKNTVTAMVLAASLVLVFACGIAQAVEPANVSFDLAKDSKVSIAIFDQHGQIVRQLLLGEQRKAGANTAAWDGLDEANKPVAPGKYTWKLLSSDGLKAHWVTMFGSGLNPGHQIMPGNHIGAMNVAITEDGDVCVIAGMGEAVVSMARVTRQGKALWYSDHLVEGVNDCGSGVAGGKLYCLLNNGKVICLDVKTGKGQWKKDQGWASPGKWWRAEQSEYWMSARGSDVVLSNKQTNVIRWVNPADGSKLDEAAVQAPQAVATDGKGNVFAISGDTVVCLTRKDKTPKQIVSGLSGACRLDVDPASGEILVAERGESNQVKRFSADGKLLATYGRKGGRAYGLYKPEDFRGITDVKADGKGGFVVVEGAAAPTRVAFFDKDGKHTGEWCGGYSYSCYGSLDPSDVSSIWYFNKNDMINARIDYEKGTSRIEAIYKLDGLAQGMAGAGQGNWTIKRYKDKLFLWAGGNYPMLMCIDDKNYTVKVVMTSDIHVQHAWENDAATPQIVRDAVFDGNVPKEKSKSKIPKDRQMYVWNDLNEDGMPQREEIVFSEFNRKAGYGGRSWVDDDMNYYLCDEHPQILRVKSWTKSGMPIYGRWTDFENIAQTPSGINARALDGFAGSAIAKMPDNEGYMGFFNSTLNAFGKGMHSESLGGNHMVRWDKDGKVMWMTGRHSPDFGIAAGEARVPWLIAGIVNGCMAVVEMQCYFDVRNAVYVWDKDGLWVGRLLDDPDLSAAPKEAYGLCTENFGGTVMEVTEQNKAPGLNVGDVVFIGAGQNQASVYRITGWDSFKRHSGTVDVTPEQAELAKSAAHAAAVKRSGTKSKAKVFAAANLPRLSKAPIIDGKLGDEAWQGAGVADDFRHGLKDDQSAPEPVKAMLGYDDKNLYIAIHCDEPNMATLKAFGKQQGEPLHIEDGVEIFIDRMCDRANYLQLIVNTNGVYYAGVGWKPVKVDVTVKAGHEKDAWNLELAVPWSEFANAYGQISKDTKVSDKAPTDGERLGFNIVRNRYAGGEQTGSLWAPLFGNFNHSPNLFGTLYVGAEMPSLAKTLTGGGAAFWKLGDRKMALDGKLNDWSGIKPFRVMDGSKLLAQLYLGWKDDGLYAAFDVKTDRPWKNTSSFEMAFNGGAAVDINIGPADATAKMAPGTARFLVAPLDGKATMVEFLPQLLEGMAQKEKSSKNYHTPAQGDADFARVAVVGDAAAALANPAGYVVEMKLPAYAAKPRSGVRMKFDATIILANPDGTLSELRIPWHSNSGDDMFVRSDVVVETTLRPANWGVAELE